MASIKIILSISTLQQSSENDNSFERSRKRKGSKVAVFLETGIYCSNALGSIMNVLGKCDR